MLFFFYFGGADVNVLQSDPNDPNGPDLETKIEELRQTMRKAEVSVLFELVYATVVRFLTP